LRLELRPTPLSRPPFGKAEAFADIISDDLPILGKAVNAEPSKSVLFSQRVADRSFAE
jgi:hypothetical protein